MATNLVADMVLEVSLYHQMDAQVAINVLKYIVLSVTSTPSDLDLAEAIGSNYDDNILPWLASEATYAGNKVRILYPGPLLPPPVFSSAGAGSGLGGAAIPGQCTGLLRKKGSVQGPKGRGRIYVPFPGNSMRTSDSVSTAGRTALDDIANLLIDTDGKPSFTTVGGVVNLQMILSLNGSPPNAIPVIGYDRANSFATQKRRGIFGRVNVLPGELI